MVHELLATPIWFINMARQPGSLIWFINDPAQLSILQTGPAVFL